VPEQVAHREQLPELVRLNAAELLRSFRLPQSGGLGALIGLVARVPAARLALQMLKFDQLVESKGLTAAADYLLQNFTAQLSVEIEALPPRGGPLVVVSNHPGMVDAMAIWSALGERLDLVTMARDQRLLWLLPNIRRHLILVAPNARALALRQAIAHLRQGGALLTFPAGTIEPDPAIRGAALSEADWSSSIDLLARAVPGLAIIPAAVGGVISPKALRHPLSRWFDCQTDREWAAATLQVLFARYRDTHTRLVLGAPIEASKIARGAAGRSVILQMNKLLARVALRSAGTFGPAAR
jgi:putative hemolysin